jgi:hypothetical protein
MARNRLAIAPLFFIPKDCGNTQDKAVPFWTVSLFDNHPIRASQP